MAPTTRVRRDRGRIDRILVPEGVRVLRAEVLTPRRSDGGPLSDHLLVLVDIDPASLPRAPEGSGGQGRVPLVGTKLPPGPVVGASLRASAILTEEP